MVAFDSKLVTLNYCLRRSTICGYNRKAVVNVGKPVIKFQKCGFGVYLLPPCHLHDMCSHLHLHHLQRCCPSSPKSWMKYYTSAGMDGASCTEPPNTRCIGKASAVSLPTELHWCTLNSCLGTFFSKCVFVYLYE